MILYNNLAFREDGSLALSLEVKEVPQNTPQGRLMIRALVINVRGAFGSFDVYGDTTEETIESFGKLVTRCNAGILDGKELQLLLDNARKAYIPPEPPKEEAKPPVEENGNEASPADHQ